MELDSLQKMKRLTIHDISSRERKLSWRLRRLSKKHREKLWLVNVETENASVNWSYFCGFSQTNEEDALWKLLLEFGILSHESRGTVSVFHNNRNFCPIVYEHQAFFVRGLDAYLYMRAQFSHEVIKHSARFIQNGTVIDPLSGIFNKAAF